MAVHPDDIGPLKHLNSHAFANIANTADSVWGLCETGNDALTVRHLKKPFRDFSTQFDFLREHQKAVTFLLVFYVS